MQETTECLIKDLEHSYNYAQAENGSVDYICWLCGHYLMELEDFAG